MRLAEYLFDNPGGPPQLDHGDNSHMAVAQGEQGLSGHALVPHAYPMGDTIAQLDGHPNHYLSQGYNQWAAMQYRHVLGEGKQYRVSDKHGNKLAVEVTHDKDDDEYVALVRGGRSRKMASGNERQPIRAHATGKTPAEAVKALRKKMGESISGHSVLTLDEVLKKGKNEPSARDRQAIKRLQDGNYPAKAEDGKGFCFQWADGRGICAFKMRSDALRWAKASPRDIVKFWYGEPVHSNGKFRIRVSDHYRKEETTNIETFSALLERRVS